MPKKDGFPVHVTAHDNQEGKNGSCRGPAVADVAGDEFIRRQGLRRWPTDGTLDKYFQLNMDKRNPGFILQRTIGLRSDR